VLPLNSNLTRPRPENHSSSSASRSKVPAVSSENAWTLANGREVKSFFLHVDRDDPLAGEHDVVAHSLVGHEDLLAVEQQPGDLGLDLLHWDLGQLDVAGVLEVDHHVLLCLGRSTTLADRRAVGPGSPQMPALSGPMYARGCISRTHRRPVWVRLVTATADSVPGVTHRHGLGERGRFGGPRSVMGFIPWVYIGSALRGISYLTDTGGAR
jgi:hypothetical protein